MITYFCQILIWTSLRYCQIVGLVRVIEGQVNTLGCAILGTRGAVLHHSAELVKDPIYRAFDPYQGHYIWSHFSNILELNTYRIHIWVIMKCVPSSPWPRIRA